MRLTQTILVVLNHLLQHEAWARDQLRPYTGQAICCRLPLGTLTVAVNDKGLLCLAQDEPVIVTFDIPVAAVHAFLVGGKTQALKLVHIEGDAQCAATLSLLLEQVRWEAEEDVAKIVGAAPAHQLMQGIGQLRDALKQIHHTATANLVEYLVYEQPTLVSQLDQTSFTEQISTLRDDLARLEKRIARL